MMAKLGERVSEREQNRAAARGRVRRARAYI